MAIGDNLKDGTVMNCVIISNVGLTCIAVQQSAVLIVDIMWLCYSYNFCMIVILVKLASVTVSSTADGFISMSC